MSNHRYALIDRAPGWLPDPGEWETLFVPWSGKHACRVCGRTGYHGWPGPAPWQERCLRGHAVVPCCGAVRTLYRDGSPRRVCGGGRHRVDTGFAS